MRNEFIIGTEMLRMVHTTGASCIRMDSEDWLGSITFIWTVRIG